MKKFIKKLIDDKKTKKKEKKESNKINVNDNEIIQDMKKDIIEIEKILNLNTHNGIIYNLVFFDELPKKRKILINNAIIVYPKKNNNILYFKFSIVFQNKRHHVSKQMYEYDNMLRILKEMVQKKKTEVEESNVKSLLKSFSPIIVIAVSALSALTMSIVADISNPYGIPRQYIDNLDTMVIMTLFVLVFIIVGVLLCICSFYSLGENKRFVIPTEWEDYFITDKKSEISLKFTYVFLCGMLCIIFLCKFPREEFVDTRPKNIKVCDYSNRKFAVVGYNNNKYIIERLTETTSKNIGAKPGCKAIQTDEYLIIDANDVAVKSINFPDGAYLLKGDTIIQ